MSLYVRLDIGYWSHRKTMRLVATLGPEAICLPPRLWCYAAQNQPDGDFSDYSEQELAMLMQWSSNASSMIQALQKAGFMDGMKIHDWRSHNGYHDVFAERAKKAAAARWKKERSKERTEIEKTGEERKGKEPSIAASNAQASLSNASSIPSSIPGIPGIPGIPRSLQTPAFQDAWELWGKHRREKRKPLEKTPTSMTQQLSKLSEWGEVRAIAAIHYSVRNGYEGIFEERQNGTGAPKHSRVPIYDPNEKF